MVLFGLLLIVVLAVHLVCVNLASAGPILSVWLEWRQARDRRRVRPDCDLAYRVNRMLAWLAPAALLVGGLLGLVAGLLVWNSGLRESVAAMPGKIKWAVPEYLFSLILMAGYYAWLRRAPQAGTGQTLGRSLVALIAGTNLLYHFPFLFVILASVADAPQVVDSEIDAAAFRQWMIAGPVLSQVVHFLLASFAVTAMSLLVWARRSTVGNSSTDADDDAARVARWAGWWALVPTLLQVPVGFWLLIQQPPEVSRALMGGDVAVSLALAVSVLAALALMHHLGILAFGQASPAVITRTLALMGLVVVLMTGVLRATHTARVSPPQTASSSILHSPASPPAHPTQDSLP